MARENEIINAINLICQGTKVTGDIESNRNIRIDGQLNGKLNTTGKVVIGNTGSIEGEIICENIEISGSITGNIRAKELISLKSTSKIHGDIHADKLAIEPGAVFTGSCEMSKKANGNELFKKEKKD